MGVSTAVIAGGFVGHTGIRRRNLADRGSRPCRQRIGYPNDFAIA
jgi:hypothetical protein